MKTKSIVLLLALVAIAALLVVSCQFMSVSIEQRVLNFQESLNNVDRTETYKNLHPDSPAYTTVGATTTLWDLKFPVGDIPYTISGLPADPEADPMNVYATISASVYGVVPARFVMELYLGSDWRIADIQLDEGSGYVTIF